MADETPTTVATGKTQHRISESADKIELKTKLKRGTGTRDEDKYALKVKGDDPETVAQRMAALQQAMQESGLVTDNRALQPANNE